MLPKKDDKFDEIITQLRTTPSAEMSSRYTQIRIRVIDYRLKVFSGIATFVFSIQAGSSYTALIAGPVLNNNLYIRNYIFAGDLIDDPILDIING